MLHLIIYLSAICPIGVSEISHSFTPCIRCTTATQLQLSTYAFFPGAILSCPTYYSLLQTKLRLQTPEGINLDFISNSQEKVKEMLEENKYSLTLEYSKDLNLQQRLKS